MPFLRPSLFISMFRRREHICMLQLRGLVPALGYLRESLRLRSRWSGRLDFRYHPRSRLIRPSPKDLPVSPASPRGTAGSVLFTHRSRQPIDAAQTVHRCKTRPGRKRSSATYEPQKRYERDQGQAGGRDAQQRPEPRISPSILRCRRLLTATVGTLTIPVCESGRTRRCCRNSAPAPR